MEKGAAAQGATSRAAPNKRTCKRKRKSPEGPENEQPHDPTCLLVVGEDALSKVVKFLHPVDLCKLAVCCKNLRGLVNPVLDDLTDDMTKNCHRLSDAEGGRIQLIRYVNAMELMQQVRSGMGRHLRKDRRTRDGFRPAACSGCTAFPQRIDEGVFFTNGSGHEFFVCFFEGTSGIKFSGFMPMQPRFIAQKNDGAWHRFEIPSDEFVPALEASKWNDMKELLSEDIGPEIGSRHHQGPSWKAWMNTMSSQLSCIVIAIEKNTCNASLLAANRNYSDHQSAGPVRFWCTPKFTTCSDVHIDTSDVARCDVPSTSFSLSYRGRVHRGAGRWKKEMIMDLMFFLRDSDDVSGIYDSDNSDVISSDDGGEEY